MILVGFLLGFLGYLPLGNINLAVVQVAVSESRRTLWSFILFVAFMEFVYCFACMMGMNYLVEQKELMTGLKWISVALFIALGLLTIFQKQGNEKGTVSPGMAKGIFVAIFNPLQLPFWLIWGMMVLKNKWVANETASIAIFSLLCAFGTIAVLVMYAEGGKKLVEKLKLNQNVINRSIGIFLIGLAVYQAISIVYFPS
ncbi:MAG: LysE family transporter [Chitinophagales bacterium]